MSSKVPIISNEELDSFHTGILMTRRKALLKCEESFELSDQFDHGSFAQQEFIEFKNTPQWKQAYAELKMVLSTRENVLNKKERKALRQAKAK